MERHYLILWSNAGHCGVAPTFSPNQGQSPDYAEGPHGVTRVVVEYQWHKQPHLFRHDAKPIRVRLYPTASWELSSVTIRFPAQNECIKACYLSSTGNTHNLSGTSVWVNCTHKMNHTCNQRINQKHLVNGNTKTHSHTFSWKGVVATLHVYLRMYPSMPAASVILSTQTDYVNQDWVVYAYWYDIHMSLKLTPTKSAVYPICNIVSPQKSHRNV